MATNTIDLLLNEKCIITNYITNNLSYRSKKMYVDFLLINGKLYVNQILDNFKSY